MTDPIADSQTRLTHWRAEAADADLRATRVSRIRLTSFLAGATLLLWGLDHRSALLTAAGAALLVVYGELVAVHARILARVDRAQGGIWVHETTLARIARDWPRLPLVDLPAHLDLDRHPYARDLDVAGPVSLARWLGPAATPLGARRLWAALLQNDAAAAEIGIRQHAVEELARDAAFREALAIEGRLLAVSGHELTMFLEWAESTRSAAPDWMRVAAPAITLSLWILGALYLTGVLSGEWWMIPLVIGIVLSYALAAPVHSAFMRASMGQRALDRYAAMIDLIAGRAWSSPPLAAAGRELGGAHPAATEIRRLARLAGFSEMHSGAAILHFPVQAVTLWDFHILARLEAWRRRSGRSVRTWVESLGGVDALSVLARPGADHPAWALPVVEASAGMLHAEGIGHPLLPDDRRVANDVSIGPRGSLLLITGSNMSGKSTLLRAVGLNVVLAQAGARVSAAGLRLPLVELQTSIRVQDSLELGLSYFMAAVARLKQIVDATDAAHRDGRTVLYLLDEILQGTNSAERAIAVRAVAQRLLDAGAIGAMTTHDLAIAGQEPLRTAASPWHFSEQIARDGSMTFDYRLQPGLATSTNALRLLQAMGIEPREPD